MTDTGALDHFVTVTEHHQVSEKALDIGTEINARNAARRDAWQRTSAAAHVWAEQQGPGGLELTNVLTFDNGRAWGVTFDVVIGTGAPDGDPHAWIWSARWRDWWRVLDRRASAYRQGWANTAAP